MAKSAAPDKKLGLRHSAPLNPRQEPPRDVSGVEPAGIEYVGVAGASKECKDSVLRLIQWGDRITRVQILSCDRDHCLLLTINVGDQVAVKSGFSSGYGGEGPHTFSCVLQILDSHGADIEEYKVPQDLIERLDESALRKADVEMLDALRPVRPTRWHEYVLERHQDKAGRETLWQEEFPPVVPFAIIDSRIMDLARSFWVDPDGRLLIGYRRLEDHVRKRTGIDHHGAKLFSQAFQPDSGSLIWSELNEGERASRMNLFTGAFGAHRNPRAHKELLSEPEALLAEFLLLNHLYRLEAGAVTDPGSIRKRARRQDSESIRH